MQDSGKALYLSDGKAGLRIESTEPVDFKPGDRLDVTGFPRVADFTLAVEDAVCRRIGHQSPLSPRAVTVDQILTGDYDFLPVAIEGRLLGRSVLGDSQTLALKNGRVVFRALIRQPPGASRVTAPVDSLLRVAGICVTFRDLNDRDLAFRIFIQSASDVTVLQQPPWWTVPKAVVVFSLLVLAITMRGLGWVVILQRRKGSLPKPAAASRPHCEPAGSGLPVPDEGIGDRQVQLHQRRVGEHLRQDRAGSDGERLPLLLDSDASRRTRTRCSANSSVP